jgi:hypothetical protein
MLSGLLSKLRAVGHETFYENVNWAKSELPSAFSSLHLPGNNKTAEKDLTTHGKITRLPNWYVPLSNTQAAWHKFISKTNLRAEGNNRNYGPLIAVLWDVTPCGSRKNTRFGGTYRPHHQGEKNQRARNNVSSN